MMSPRVPVAAGSPRSLSGLASLFMTLLVMYASLYPFEGWRWPAGLEPTQALSLPWPRWRDRPDEWFNFLGYVPVGLVYTVALLRRGAAWWWAPLAGVAAPAAVSYLMEVLQVLLPARVPSLRDWMGNAGGSLVGALLGLALHISGSLQRLRLLRDRWFSRHSAPALILIGLWPAALLYPAPMPFGLGQVWDDLMAWVVPLLSSMPLSTIGIDLDLSTAAPARQGLAPLTEVAAITLGLLSPLALACAASPEGGRRWWFVPVAGILGVGGMTLSTALNFGPDHATAWLTPQASFALLLAVPLACLMVWASPRINAVLGLLVLATALVLASQARTNAYYAASLQAWEQGRFIHFHGLAQWVGWLWPYAAMGWLVQHLVRPPESLQFR